MMERDVANTARSGRPCHRSQVTTFTWRLYGITRPLILPVADSGLCVLNTNVSYQLCQNSERLRDVRQVLDFRQGQRSFFGHDSGLALNSTQTGIQWVSWVPFFGVKQPGRDAVPSLPSNVNVKNARSCSYIHTYALLHDNKTRGYL